MCKENHPEMGTRCVLEKALCRVDVETHYGGKQSYFPRRLMIRYTYEAPIEMRVAECLGIGIGGIKIGDAGGRVHTFVEMEYKGETADGGECFEVTAKEYFKELPGKILERTAKSAGKLSRAQISRNERNRDAKAKAYYKTLKARIEKAKADGKTSKAQIKAMEKQLNKQNKVNAKTEVEEMAEAPAGRDGEMEEEQAVREEMATTDAAFKEKLTAKAARIEHDKKRMLERAKVLKREFKDEFLGPLWTEEVEERYKHHCGKRRRGIACQCGVFSQVQGGEAHAAARQVDQHGDAQEGGGGAGRNAGGNDSGRHESAFVPASTFTTLRSCRIASRSTLATWRWPASTIG